MEWLASIFSGGTSAIFGGVLGAIGGVFQKWMDYRQQIKLAELQSIERNKERTHDLAVMDREAVQAEKLAVIKTDGEIRVADLSALQESIKNEGAGATWSSAWAGKLSGLWANIAGMCLVVVDMVRGLTRPGITLGLVLLVAYMFVRVSEISGNMTQEQAFEICQDITNMTLFLAATAVSWWFGSRGPASFKK